MAKELTLPTPPAAPSVPRVGIGDRLQGIEDRINDIENIGNMNGISTNQNNHSKPTFNSQAAADNDSDESEQEQTQPQQSQSTQQSVHSRQPSSKTVTNPESMARDAVANGAGALTKRTTTRGGDDNTNNSDADNSQSKNQSTIVIPPDSALNDSGQSKFERGRAVLKEFQQLDKENKAQSTNEYSSSSSTSSSAGIFSSSYGTHSQHGAFYWLFTLVAIGVLAFVFVKQFLLKDKSPIKPTVKSPVNSKQSSISNEPSISNSIKTTPITKAVKNYLSKSSEQAPTQTPPPVKTVTIKSKTPANTEDKGKRFEVRI